MKRSSSVDKETRLGLVELTGSRWLGNVDGTWLNSQFEQYQRDKSLVEPEWAALFDKLTADTSWSDLNYTEPVIPRPNYPLAVETPPATESALSRASLTTLIEAFRTYGHLAAQVDPLKLSPTLVVPELDLSAHALDRVDQNTSFHLGGELDLEETTLAKLLSRLKKLYCGGLGYEYQHISSQTQREWWSEHIEKYHAINTKETKKRILHRLLESDGLEKHLATQFVGQKRFSIEGADSLMPMLDTLVIAGAEQNITQLNIGMAHRGRLNVLINLLGKAPSELFKEFSGQYSEGDPLSGDVKYHKGFSAILKTKRGEVAAELSFNPSHLEIVNPVVEGITRAKQDIMASEEEAYHQVLPLLIHGDASFSGQGVIMETLQLSQVNAYHTGGTIHVVLNNQVGFTTEPRQARSTRYCTDIGKMIEAPILHVNGNDPEAACRAMDLALGFRKVFSKDVIIDLVCYRRHGHNEGDEPAATQPVMYQAVRAQAPVWNYYAGQLREEGVIEEGEAEAWLSDYRKRVAAGHAVAELATESLQEASATVDDWRATVKTAVSLKAIENLQRPLTALPSDMQLQPQVAKLMADRQKMLQGALALNWGTAETLAYATLLSEGFAIRLTGQDTERGTFAHRHAVLHDYKTGALYTPLAELAKVRQQFSVYDSILSEMATMGFEYGYASARKEALVIWEAQYGDFVNGAQLVIDQFMSASEQKWGRLSGLVLFLPHGYEGAGPEHSSARLERFLQLCAQDNMQVCVPTTPAQHFHLLRRQLLRKGWAKPLVVMTPKSLLRHKQATSALSELSEGTFQAVIDDSVAPISKNKVKRIVICSGKVYYDLLAHKVEDYETAIVRIEQLYPFPDKELAAVLNGYSEAAEVVWCQEEPKNQGAWQWIGPLLKAVLGPSCTLSYVGRPAAAATAVGSPLRHAVEQKKLIEEALG